MTPHEPLGAEREAQARESAARIRARTVCRVRAPFRSEAGQWQAFWRRAPQPKAAA